MPNARFKLTYRMNGINRDNVKWAVRMAVILVIVALADGLVGAFASKPFPWVVVIPATMPLLASIFVIFPMLRAEKTQS
jgi:hypothetical protein